jgi:hypothetical protein
MTRTRERFKTAVLVLLLAGVSHAAEPECEKALHESPAPPAATSSEAPVPAMPLYIQTSQPWTVVLDSAGNPAAVIVSEPPPSRLAPSALFGRRLASIAVAALVLSETAHALVLCTTPDGKTYAGDKPPPGCEVKSRYTSPPAPAEPQPAEPAAADASAEQRAADNAFMAQAFRRRREIEDEINAAADRLIEAHNSFQRVLVRPDDWANAGRHREYQNIKDNYSHAEDDARVRIEQCREDFKKLTEDVRDRFHGILPPTWRTTLNCGSCP